MLPGIADKIPYNQEIIHISHGFNHAQLILQPVRQFLCHLTVPHFQPLPAKPVQVFPGRISFRHIEPGQFCHSKLDIHMASFRYFVGVFQSLGRIGKQLGHLLGRFHIILAPFIAHPVLVRQLFSGLEAEENIVGPGIFRIGIVNVVGGHQLYSKLTAHAQKLLVHHFLFRYPVVLQLQKEISFPENFLIAQGRLPGVLIESPGQVPLYLTRQAGAQGDQPLMIFPQYLQIHPGLVVEALHESFGHDFHQIGIPLIIFRQQHQMIVPVIGSPFPRLSVKPGAGSYIDFTP